MVWESIFFSSSFLKKKKKLGDGDWVDLYNRVIRFEPEEWGVPLWEHKLYGGQQFERLLAEFSSVVRNTHITEITPDDVATATGINKLNNIPNYAWTVSFRKEKKFEFNPRFFRLLIWLNINLKMP